MFSGARQLGGFALFVTVLSLACLSYVAIVQPDSLRRTRAGVAYFTPPVEHPETGEAIPLDVLIEHYKGIE